MNVRQKKGQEEAAPKAASGVPPPATKGCFNWLLWMGSQTTSPVQKTSALHKGDQSSFNVSHNEDVVREPEVKETAYEETETESSLLHALNEENQEPISEEAR